MKAMPLIVAAAALLASCDTVPRGDPYAPPYYPYDPALPPPGSFEPPPGPMETCPVQSAHSWQAWVNAMPGPGQQPTLHVTGVVVTPSAAHRVEFVPVLEERRSYPVQVVARLWVLSPTGGASGPAHSHQVRWNWPLKSGPVGSLTITCGERTIAENLPVRTAH